MPEKIDAIRQSFTGDFEKIRGLAKAYLGYLRRDEDAVAEVVALSWKAYQDLALQGRDVVKLLGKIVDFSARYVRSGGRLVGMQPVRDVMSATARFRHKYRVNSLPLSEADDTAPEIIDAMRDDASPANDAAFRIDLEEWLSGLDERKQQIVGELRSGYNTVEVARLHRVSRMRIFQLRQELIDSWEARDGSETAGSE